MTPNSDIERVVNYFKLIYLNGIPPAITDASAYLSFICTFCALEAVAGYRYGPKAGKAKRFQDLVTAYFPPHYKGVESHLWRLRNSMVHAFSATQFELTHNHPEQHFKRRNDRLVLDAHSFYEEMKEAAEKYFAEMALSPERQRVFGEYINSENGGLTVGPGLAGIVVTGGMW